MKRERFGQTLEFLRGELQEMRAEGYTDDAVREFLVNFITYYEPKDNPLWTARQLSMIFKLMEENT